MKDVAVIAYGRTGIARARRGALNQTHGIPLTAHVLRKGRLREIREGTVELADGDEVLAELHEISESA